jgi:hypothetical protein
MDLTGHHSNPSRPFRALLDGGLGALSGLDRTKRDPTCRDRPEAAIGSRHRRHDWVQAAVIRVLERSQESMQARDVHAAVEALLGEPVRWGSVKACLAANVAGPSPRFIRTAPGRYSTSLRDPQGDR